MLLTASTTTHAFFIAYTASGLSGFHASERGPTISDIVTFQGQLFEPGLDRKAESLQALHASEWNAFRADSRASHDSLKQIG